MPSNNNNDHDDSLEPDDMESNESVSLNINIKYSKNETNDDSTVEPVGSSTGTTVAILRMDEKTAMTTIMEGTTSPSPPPPPPTTTISVAIQKEIQSQQITDSDSDLLDQIIQTYLPNNNKNGNGNSNSNSSKHHPIPNSHIRVGLTNLLQMFQKDIRTVLYHQRLPMIGWSDYNIQYFLNTLSSLDTNCKSPIIQQSSSLYNNQQRWVGVGEREGKIYSSLVLQRHYGYSHGMGRSGNLFDPQPKAVGSTILVQLTNQLLYDVIVRGGSQIQLQQQLPVVQQVSGTENNHHKHTKQPLMKGPHSIILPSCTGMSIALVLQSLRQKHLKYQRQLQQTLQPTSTSLKVVPKDIVLWSRIDQKSCYKAIIAAGLQCIVIPTKIDNDSVVTDIQALDTAIQTYTPSRILAIITTTSCFAPRVPDQVDVVAKMIQQYNQENNTNENNCNSSDQHMYHIINHAYGLQCSKTGKLITRAMTIGQVDAIVCSLDKNFLVPVSGSVVLSPSPPTIQQIGKFYAGRACSSHIMDVCITLLSMGLHGYQELHQQRQNTLLPKFILQFQTIATKYNERLLTCPANTISFAMTLDHLVRPRRLVSTSNDTIDGNDASETEEVYLKSLERELTQLGAMLFHRCVSGTRVVARNVQQTLGDNDIFYGFGSSTNNYPHAYITAACAIGLNEMEMNEFFTRLDKTIHEFQKKQRRKKS